ncbi:MAG: 3-isopropylmalate dehydrogenase, partial [Acidobacteria bacterium]|nr:3-isopropylmalate dehydrogenase [Acidobacteriota bacterium]
PPAAIGAAAMPLAELGETEAAEGVERAAVEVAGSLPSLRRMR